MGIAVLEMQASGLPVVASDAVPNATVISNRISFLSLKEKPEKWAKELEVLLQLPEDFYEDNKIKWDIQESIKHLETLYEKTNSRTTE